jgi:membrane associated rhomboid family serine protease
MFNPAQMITYMFLHANFWHLFFNMFGLYMFGRILEEVLGPKRFLFYYFITGLGAAIVQQLMWTIEIHPIIESVNAQLGNGAAADLLAQKEMFLNQFITIGASGAVFGLLLAFGMMFPDQPLFLMFIPIPIKAKYFVIGYAVFELVFGVGNFSFDNVAHFAHLGGMLFGFFVLLYWRKKR